MKRRILVGIILCAIFLVGCVKEPTFGKFFHKDMTERFKDDDFKFSYTLIHTELNAIHENDAIAIFTEHNIQGEQIILAYFEKKNKQWEWIRTNGGAWNTPIKWSSMIQEPYIYSGPISDDSIIEVYAGGEEAKMITVEQDKRYWYAISPVQDVEVFYIKEDGKKEKVERIQHD